MLLDTAKTNLSSNVTRGECLDKPLEQKLVQNHKPTNAGPTLCLTCLEILHLSESMTRLLLCFHPTLQLLGIHQSQRRQ